MLGHAPPTTVRASHRSFLLPVARVRPNPRSARLRIDEHALDALAESLRTWGQLQPVVVRRVEPASPDYEIVCGQRRWLAHQRAGIDMLWVVEWDATDQEALALALMENLQRVNLSHAEKVAALEQLAELSQARGLRQTARELRVDPSWLSRQLAVRRDPRMLRAFEAGQLSVGQAAELLRAPTGTREFLLRRVTRSPEHVPVATVRAWVEEARASSKTTAQPVDASSTGGYRQLLKEFRQLQPPTTDDDRLALQELLASIHQVLERSSASPVRPSRQTVSEWIDLSCLMCGERTRVHQSGNRLTLAAAASVRRCSGRLVCGRCGGAVAPGDRGRQYSY